jgi:hypothetical protein
MLKFEFLIKSFTSRSLTLGALMKEISLLLSILSWLYYMLLYADAVFVRAK